MTTDGINPSPRVLERALRPLGGEGRKCARWEPPRLRSLCAGLVRPDVTEEHLRGVAWEALGMVAPFAEALERGELPCEGEELFARALGYSRGTDLEDAVEWSTGAITRYERALREGDVPCGTRQSTCEGAGWDFWCAAVALCALEVAAERGVEPDGLIELAELSYHFASAAVKRIHRERPGLELDPDVGLSRQERLRRFLRTAELLRKSLTESDLDVLEAARSRPLP